MEPDNVITTNPANCQPCDVLKITWKLASGTARAAGDFVGLYDSATCHDDEYLASRFTCAVGDWACEVFETSGETNLEVVNSAVSLGLLVLRLLL